MATGPATNPHAEQLTNLKQAFEAAVQVLHGEMASRSKQPIYPRKQATVAESKPDQNRALKEAAEALAAIWKTSNKPATRPNPRRNDSK
jgi:hypothetical protein